MAGGRNSSGQEWCGDFKGDSMGHGGVVVHLLQTPGCCASKWLTFQNLLAPPPEYKVDTGGFHHYPQGHLLRICGYGSWLVGVFAEDINTKVGVPAPGYERIMPRGPPKAKCKVGT